MDAPADFEWDDAKAESNLAKHAISFVSAQAVFLDPDHVVVDVARSQDGEARQKVLGRLGGRLFAVVFVMRGDVCRIISARRTNKAEDAAYGYR